MAMFDSPSIYSLLYAHGWVYFLASITFLTAMSVVGDLVESMVKRTAGVKDSRPIAARPWRRFRPCRCFITHLAFGHDVVSICSMAKLNNAQLQRITILGSTGSIGVNTLDVISRHPNRFEVFALTGATQVDLMLQQCVQFKPSMVVMAHADAAKQLQEKLNALGLGIRVQSGSKALEEVASHPQVDSVMAGYCGCCGS
jgi:hypothetical protein